MSKTFCKGVEMTGPMSDQEFKQLLYDLLIDSGESLSFRAAWVGMYRAEGESDNDLRNKVRKLINNHTVMESYVK